MYKFIKRLKKAAMAVLLIVSVAVNAPVLSAADNLATGRELPLAPSLNGQFLAEILPPAAGSIPIYDRAGLEAIKDNLDGTYHLAADIDLAGSEWEPIGVHFLKQSFTGVFDGQGRVIRNMTITESNSASQYGLFTHLSDAEIINVGLEDIDIDLNGDHNSNGQVGGIVSVASTSRIDNSYTTGKINVVSTRLSSVGGICGGTVDVGIEDESTVANCYNECDISLTNTLWNNMAAVGGLCGSSLETRITNCYNMGNVSAFTETCDTNVGGICGASSSFIDGCANYGNVNASSETNESSSGGICGYAESIISNSCNAGDIFAFSNAEQNKYADVAAGGICGASSINISYGLSTTRTPSLAISNCYNIGFISAANTNPTPTAQVNIGEITAAQTGEYQSVTNCYFLGYYGSDYGYDEIGTFLNAEQMGNPDSYVGFDFDNVWTKSENYHYPMLRGLTGAVTPSTNNETEVTVESIGVGIKITWSFDENDDGYNIYRSEVEDEQGELINSEPLVDTEYIDVHVEPDTTYYYSVYKVVDGVETPLSDDENVTSVTTGDEILGTEFGDRRGYILMQIGKDTMIVNDATMEIDPGRGTSPVILNNRTMVPIRAIIETIGGTADWDEAEGKVTITLGEKTLEMWLGQLQITVDGTAQTVDVAPSTINDRTILPVRFVAENLNCIIEWLEATQEVVIVYEVIE